LTLTTSPASPRVATSFLKIIFTVFFLVLNN
jgi:hypothetical protein